VGKLATSHRYDLRTLAAVKPWGIPRELVVWDFPIFAGTKVVIKVKNQKLKTKYFSFLSFFCTFTPQTKIIIE
jgi:hypothetical protein